MKKLFFLITLMLVSTSLFAVEYKEEMSYEKEFESTQSIKVAKLWVSDNFKSSKDVIDLYDEELGVLTGNGLCTYMKGILLMEYRFKFKISIKENKVKVTFNNFRVGQKRNIPNAKSTGLQDFYNELEEIAESIFKYYEEF